MFLYLTMKRMIWLLYFILLTMLLRVTNFYFQNSVCILGMILESGIVQFLRLYLFFFVVVCIYLTCICTKSACYCSLAESIECFAIHLYLLINSLSQNISLSMELRDKEVTEITLYPSPLMLRLLMCDCLHCLLCT